MYTIYGNEAFGIYGKAVKLNRYKLEWEAEETRIDDEGNMLSETVCKTDYFPDDDRYKHTISALKVADIECTETQIDQTGNEWIDGMEFDSCGEVQEALAMGEVVWRSFKPHTLEQLQADIDYIAIMTGVEL